jgi:hypothetical protein
MSAAIFDNVLPQSSAVCLFIAGVAAITGTQFGKPIGEGSASPSLIAPKESWSGQAVWDADKVEVSSYHASSKEFSDPTSNGDITITVQKVVLTSKKFPFQGEEGLEQRIHERYQNAVKTRIGDSKDTVLRSKPEQLLRSRAFNHGNETQFSSFELTFSLHGQAQGYEDKNGPWKASPAGTVLTPGSLILALRQHPIKSQRAMTVFYPLWHNGELKTEHNATISMVAEAIIVPWSSKESILCNEYMIKVGEKVVDRIWIEKADSRRLVQRKSTSGQFWLLKSHSWRTE